ncbi:hypothetical protein PFICI_13502 [Pestalotiopsis fici W106-1]|uniref:NACHT domain-containing protein n=1 Tax=Pestalotiopsis fici (strain W106-1 / CGMCC3.15140) TaxID=1229662 RepID=W3WMB9_PESFW|nr:uncharacterized protein PFICI_13502 [Pestalotiopsis fici W106-1]ETS75018.1 hypothetical protein PFICI_13502 [Pestalotiopsis fici W106-1]
MERATKRPRLVDSSEPPQNAHHNHQESSRFDGTGIAIRDGTVQVQGDLYVNSSHATEETKNINPARERILESLRFEQIDARQLSIKKAHSKTCQWFLKTALYRKWESRDLGSHDSRFLWIKGKPGAGKSTLMRFLLEHNRSLARRSSRTEVLISFFFNARGESLEKSTLGLYRSLLLQLLEARPESHRILDAVRPGRPWTVDLLKDLFEKALQELEETSIVCFVDALDECEETEIRDMVRFLSDLVETGGRLHICFASRHYPHITIQTVLSIVLEDQNEHGNDIARYIDARLHLKEGKRAEEIRLELREKASGVFIWVALVVEILNKEYEAGRSYALRERLRQLPSDLHNLFRDILSRDNKDRASLLLCIQWVLFAKTPLTPVQLYFALISGVEPACLDQIDLEDHSDDNIRRFVLNNSEGLAEPTKSATPTIQFIHESVRDFLLKEQDLYGIFPELQGNIVGRSHEALKQCCMSYMSSPNVVKLKPFLPDTAFFAPFLAYANQGVLHHADQAERNGISQQDFLTAFPLSQWVEHYNCLQNDHVRHYSSKASLRYIMAEAGMPALIGVLPAGQSCFDVEDERYGLPILAAAAAKNHDTVLAMLNIEARCLPNFSFEDFRSQYPPLPDKLNASSRDFTFDKSKASLPQLIQYGSEMLCLFYLLTKDEIDLRGSENRALIPQALENGFIVVAKLLIDQGADIHTADKNGETPLSRASRYGYREVVKWLLDRGADISSAADNGETPLHWASWNRHIEVAELLLDRGADVSATMNDGATPLHWASWNRHIEVTKLLLDRGANIFATANNGATPLHWTSLKGHVEVAKLLIDRGADISAAADNGTIPLHWASWNGHIELAKLLLDHGANISATGHDGATPLHWASGNGCVDLAELLLDRGADISAAAQHGATPLHWAYRNGHFGVVNLLRAHGAGYYRTRNSG